MRYRLCTLLMLLALGPPILAGGLFVITVLAESIPPAELSVRIMLLIATIACTAL